MWTLTKTLKRIDMSLVVGNKSLTYNEENYFIITPADTNWDNNKEANDALDNAFYTSNMQEALDELFAK